MRNVIRGHTVMIAQIPLTLELHDRVVSRPTYHRIEDHALITERSVRRIANGIAQIVAVTGRVREVVLAIILVHPRGLEETVRIASLVREVVLAIILVHPRGLEETVRIASLHGLAVLVEHHHVTRCLSKLLYIVAQADHAAVNGRRIGSGEELTLVVRRCTQVDESVLVAILAIDRCQTIGQRVPLGSGCHH